MTLSSLVLSVALGVSQYTEDYPYATESEYTVGLRVGLEDNPLYVWGHYEEPKIRTLGQPMGDSSIISFGLGARKNVGDFFVFGELGYGVIDEGARETIQQEIVYTDLLRNHRVDFRPAPVRVDRDYQQDSYETLWELDDGFLGKVGVGYQWGDVGLSVGYRAFYVDEHVELWDEETRARPNGGYWQESRSRDLSAWEFKASWTF